MLYPENLFNRVTYTYGKAGDKYNRAGRLALVEDASGGEAYYYGRQGEVTKTVRTVMASVADIRTYVYGATYDSWNRVQTMTYPDGEVVTYHYNAAGQVERLTSNKQGRQSVIVDRIGYDKEGHTVYTKLGNGTETTYTYDKQRERLQVMNLTADGQTVMENRYQYDAVDNILGITNAANPTSLTKLNKAKLGGRSSHTYEYDELNRLIHANGKAKRASYDMVMSFGRMSEPLTKVQKVDSTTTAKSYNFAYKYEDSNHPTAPTQIGHDHYTYDANGNPTLVTNDSANTTREMYWDEDNRLMVLSDNGKTSRYTYNAAGERIMKSYGTMEGVYINGAPQGITFHETDNFTLYPASILSVNKNRFTKHYFIGDKRVASRIGTGMFNNVYGRNGSYVTAGQQDYAERMNQIQTQKEAYYKKVGVAPGVPTEKGAYGDPENTGVGYNAVLTELGNHDVPQGWIQTPRPNTTPGTNPGAPVSWNDPSNPDDPQAGYGYIPNDTTKEETFFYHSDHLGSTSYITDDKANITQYDAYLPYGELLVDEHSSSEELPYKFNGKQFDEETGLYYYGARYMNPVASIWYGVDPLAEEYVNTGSYVYCVDNPITLIDANGKSFSYPDDQSIWSGIGSFFKGVCKSFKNTYNMVRHPINTLKTMGHAAAHPVNTAKNIWHTARERWDRAINSNDINERGEAWGETGADIAQIAAGGAFTKSATKMSVRLARNSVRVARTARAVRQSSVTLGHGAAAVGKFVGETSISELENFNNGVKVIQLTKDVNLYRYYGGLAAPMGRYLSNGALNSAVDRTGLAILPKWNKMEGVAEISVPKGTVMIKGTASSQGFPYIGGRTQYFTPSITGFKRIK